MSADLAAHDANGPHRYHGRVGGAVPVCICGMSDPGIRVESWDDQRRALARAREIIGSAPVQGRCHSCDRVYYCRAPLRGRTCPGCRRPLRQTTWAADGARYAIARSGIIHSLTAYALGLAPA